LITYRTVEKNRIKLLLPEKSKQRDDTTFNGITYVFQFLFMEF